MKTVCVITSTRADYGILMPLLRRLQSARELRMQLAVTGTHLAAVFGMTVREIEADGFPIACRIPILTDGDTPQAVSQTMANALERFSAYLVDNAPDMAVVLGDRYEIFAICAALTNARVPIAHIHGGETTEGAVDECFRHSITKMSYLHFTATEAYRKRVIQLGEAAERVFNVGALGVENALHTDLLSREALAGEIGFAALTQRPYAVVTFQPVTLEPGTETTQCEALLGAMEKFPDMAFLCTKANADTGGRRINALLEKFAVTHENIIIVASLGMRKYMSALRYADLVLGNSSSGIVEAPSFCIPTVNIGDRQKGRLMAQSVLCCPPNKEAIIASIQKARTEAFRAVAAQAVNPYGAGDTSKNICEMIKDFLLNDKINLKKEFYDLEVKA